jgi:CIC family chloride channel protein
LLPCKDRGSAGIWLISLEAIVGLADRNQCDVIVLGASRKSLLKQVVTGNIPESIARQSHCTVILVRTVLDSQ